MEPGHAVSGDFSGAGQEPGLEIWRIEKMSAVPWPVEQYGKFYNGDSYIVLHSKLNRFKKLTHDIYFWLGLESSQDEITTAAYKTVELGDSIEGSAPHHREVQGHESNSFLSLFKDGFQIITGGIESGFRKVDRDGFETRLLHCKGSRNARITRVDLTAKSLNHGDVFILDHGKQLFVWNGDKSSRNERAKALDVARGIRSNEKNGNAEVINLEDGKNDAECEEFWKVLDGKPSDVLSAEEGGSDEEFEKEKEQKTILFDMPREGALKEIAREKLQRKMLETDHVYLLETADMIYIWVGRKVDVDFKKESLAIGQKHLSDIGVPMTISMERIVEGSETAIFKDQFVQWNAFKLIDPNAEVASVGHVAGKLKQEKVDLAELRAQRHEQHTIHPDEGSLKVETFRMNNFQAEPIPKDREGIFFSGDSYVVKCEYTEKGRAYSAVYMFQGKDSTTDEKGTSAYITREIASKMIRPQQIRIVQGHETVDFLALFNGRFVVRSGGVPSGWNSAPEKKGVIETEEQATEVALFQVKGYTGPDTRAYQVETSCKSLNSGDTFVLLTPGKEYVWYGKLSNEGEKECGKKLGEFLKGERELVDFNEGSEPEEFFTALGGKTEYVTYEEDVEELPEPRLFHCSDAIGVFRAEEVENFSQDDLNVDDVMILDAFDYVYVWCGHGCNQNEIEQSLVAAKEYLSKKPDGRENTPIVTLKEGEETPAFTQHFPGWREWQKNDFVDPYQLRLQRLKEEKDGHTIAGVPSLRPSKNAKSVSSSSSSSSSSASTLPLSEDTMTEDDFQRVFKMSKEDFYKLSTIKQTMLKRNNGVR